MKARKVRKKVVPRLNLWTVNAEDEYDDGDYDRAMDLAEDAEDKADDASDEL